MSATGSVNVEPSTRRREVRGPVSAGLVLLAGFGLIFLGLPLVGLLARAPWGSMVEILTSGPALQALRLSAISATLATLCCLAFGVPLAVVLARVNARGMWVIRTLVVLPLVLPPVVGGAALLAVFGRSSTLGAWLYSSFGWQLPFTTAGVVVAEAFVAMPFVVLTVESALRTQGESYAEAASTLGASRWQVFRMITLPMVAPAVIAGAVLGFARALGEFGATVTFAGNFPGVTTTLPLAIYGGFDSDPRAATALSVLLLAFTATVLVFFRGHIAGWRRP